MISTGQVYTGFVGSNFPQNLYNYQTIPLIYKQRRTKTFEAIGYGTLSLPGHTYSDVLLVRLKTVEEDSVFQADGTFLSQAMLSQLGITNFSNPHFRTHYEHSFFANNTFGTAWLMYVESVHQDSCQNCIAYRGWYTLPVDFGSIGGTVYTDNSGATPVTNGEALLYRDGSNFAQNDILDRNSLDANGNYQFDSIPYGYYRVAIRPDTSYHYALTTYFGDSTNWLDATTINTISPHDSLSFGHDIHLQYADSLGANTVSGTLNLHYHYAGDADRDNNPIPGIDVVVRKQPGGTAISEVKTDSTGSFTIANIPDGHYQIHVDIPGSPHATTYDFCVSGGDVINGLNFESGSRYIHAVGTIDTAIYTCNPITTSVAQKQEEVTGIQAYPNPYTSNTTIKITLAQKSDLTLDVYNLLGEKVQSLDNGVKQAGNYSYNYSAASVNRPAGVYFVRLIANGKTSVLKIVEQ